MADLADQVQATLTATQRGLLDDARAFRDRHTFRPADLSEMGRLLEDPGGFMIAGWCGREECEAKVKAETKATIRFLPLEPAEPGGRCIVCGERATEEATWALAY
jgi:prolyl-tRNA synthetase